jgi:hypothetical protein
MNGLHGAAHGRRVPPDAVLRDVGDQVLQALMPMERQQYYEAKQQYTQWLRDYPEKSNLYKLSRKKQQQEYDKQFTSMTQATDAALDLLSNIQVELNGQIAAALGIYRCALHGCSCQVLCIRPVDFSFSPGEPTQPVSQKTAGKLLRKRRDGCARCEPTQQLYALQTLPRPDTFTNQMIYVNDNMRDLGLHLPAVLGYGLLIVYDSGMRFTNPALNDLLQPVVEEWAPPLPDDDEDEEEEDLRSVYAAGAPPSR